MTMIECVAKAIYDANPTFIFGLPGANGKCAAPLKIEWRLVPELRGEGGGVKERERCLKAARAAIEAMREPTKEMTGADPAWKIDCEFGDGMLTEVWQAMIDAALKP